MALSTAPNPKMPRREKEMRRSQQRAQQGRSASKRRVWANVSNVKDIYASGDLDWGTASLKSGLARMARKWRKQVEIMLLRHFAIEEEQQKTLRGMWDEEQIFAIVTFVLRMTASVACCLPMGMITEERNGTTGMEQLLGWCPWTGEKEKDPVLPEGLVTERWGLYPCEWGKEDLMVSTHTGGNMEKYLREVEKCHSSQTQSKEG